MKKKILFSIICVLFSCSIYAQKNSVFLPKVGIEAAGTHSLSGMGVNAELNVNTSLTLGMDLLKQLTNDVYFGAGVIYQTPKELDMSGAGSFNFLPVYGILKVKVLGTGQSVLPYLIGNLGYSIFFLGDKQYKGSVILKGGLYWGAGLQVEISNFIFEGMYKTYMGSAEFRSTSNSLDVNYTTLSLMFGLMI